MPTKKKLNEYKDNYPPTGVGYILANSKPINHTYIDHLVGGKKNDRLENTVQMHAIGNGQQFYKDGSDQLRHHRTDGTMQVQHSATDVQHSTDKCYQPRNRLHNMFV